MKRNSVSGLSIGAALLLFVSVFPACGQNSTAAWKGGCAAVTITPEDPVWMAGYAFRDHPMEGVRQDIRAKALALEDASGHKGVVVTIDMLSIPKDFSDALREEVSRRYGLDRSQVILNVSHTHSGPVIGRALRYIYPMGPEDWEAVDAYTRRLYGKLLDLIGASLKDCEPVRISSGGGLARFATNRRNNVENALTPLMERKGPHDYSVPVLKVERPDGTLKAVLFGYACHNTVLSDYFIGGDYAGVAQEQLQQLYPGALALFFQGAGGDQNPMPRRDVSYAVQFGKELCAAVEQVLSTQMVPLEATLDTRYSEVMLPLEDPPGFEELSEQGKGKDYQARWARGMLQEGQQGPFISAYPYPIQFWQAGSQKVFALGGELVCDYAAKLKSCYGSDIFVMGYCNDVMGYIPSPEIWDEGRYEGAVAHKVYALPARWTRDVQERILDAVATLVNQ